MRILAIVCAVWAACGLAEARPLTAAVLSSAWLAPQMSVSDAFAPVTLAAATPLVGAPLVTRGPKRLQCAVYARERSGLALSGKAATWWQKAKGVYERDQRPAEGAVIVLGGTKSGHVAVVSHVLSATAILVDHANWGNHGEIVTGALMIDVSPANDWSRVRVWHPPTNGLGLRKYPVFGFILPHANAGVRGA